MRLACVLSFALIFTINHLLYAQSSTVDYYLTVSGNLSLPAGSTELETYPILWYNSKTKPKFQIGGIGIGVSMFKEIKSKLLLKSQVTTSRHTYWDQAFEATTQNGSIAGRYDVVATDYTVGFMGTIDYYLGSKWSIGSGIAAQILVNSNIRIPELDIRVQNKSHRSFMPIVPLEVSLHLKRNYLNIRYEYQLLNLNRSDLAQDLKDKISVLSFEFGIKLTK